MLHLVSRWHWLTAASLAAVTLEAAGGCAHKPSVSAASAAPAAKPPPPLNDVGEGPDGFTYGRLEKTTAEIPTRFSAPLPSSLAEFANLADHPPHAQIRWRLCQGDAEMQGRFLAAARKAVEAGPIDKTRRFQLSQLHGYCSTEAQCRFLTDATQREPILEVRQLLAFSLQHCGAMALPALERPDSPDEALLDLYLSTNDPVLPFSKRLRAAIEATSKSRRGVDLRRVGVALHDLTDPAIPDFVAGLQARADAASKPWLAIGLGQHPSPKARRLFDQACRHPDLAEELMCQRDQAVTPPERPPTPDELAGCVRSAEEEFSRSRCLDSLARLSWDQARAVARQLSREEAALLTYSTELYRALVRFENVNHLLQHLRTQRLISQDFALASAKLEGAPDALSILTAARSLHCFDAETDRFPNEHDALLAELAALSPGVLADVVFEEQPPTKFTENPNDPATKYVLKAYTKGLLYSTRAENNGDWFDVEAVIGMLNSLLAERSSSYRYAITKGGNGCVVLGLATALVQADRDGLLPLYRVPDSATTLDQPQQLLERAE